mgnify:CR=1 FL=1
MLYLIDDNMLYIFSTRCYVVIVFCVCVFLFFFFCSLFFFQAEDGIRYLVRSRGLGDVYKRQSLYFLERLSSLDLVFGAGPFLIESSSISPEAIFSFFSSLATFSSASLIALAERFPCLLYTSDAADERSSVDLGGRRIIKKK